MAARASGPICPSARAASRRTSQLSSSFTRSRRTSIRAGTAVLASGPNQPRTRAAADAVV